MTHTPDEPNDPVEGGSSGRDQGAGRKLDEDAAWRDIVEHYGDRAEIEPDPGAGSPESASPAAADPDPVVEPGEDRDERLRGLFRPSWNDPLDTEATWEDEGHFVPPSPPPTPVLDPRRRAAWVGLFGSPLVMLVAVVLGWRLPDWLMLGLAAGFVGGFVYLIATMPNRRPGDGSGGDGAVV
jgi:hypothetical protein